MKVKSEKIFRILNGKAAMEAKGMFKRGFVNDLRETGIQQYKTDVGFRTLVESVNENLYIIPKYQRKYRWTKDQVDSLVESLIYGLPIPPIYTCRNSENQLEILDGQQRIMSLFFYYIGYYLLVSKKFALLKKPVNPSRFRTHPAVPELSALCIILAVFLKGGKNVSADSA